MLNLKELLTGDPVRLRYVQRWGTVRVLKPDTTAEHSFFVALYALVVGIWVDETYQMDADYRGRFDAGLLNMGELLGRAVVHDLEEARTGDFPRTFKHGGSETIRRCLKDAGAIAAAGICEKLDPGGPVKARLQQLWMAEKSGDVEGRILDFADFLAALSFLAQERSTWNTQLDEHRSSMMFYFGRFATQEFNFIRPLVGQAAAIMEEVFDGSKRA